MMKHRTHLHTTTAPEQFFFLIISACLLLTAGCARPVMGPDTSHAPVRAYLPRMRFSIQVGAFANIDNAVRLTESLERQGLDAYHFLHSSGLYKVRFENFKTKQAARNRALELQRLGIIEEFYIVEPAEYAATADDRHTNALLRAEIVRTARRYIGVPYRWGGESPRTGFDCSGLTMVVYRLNGLDLPRSSRQQWKTGKWVDRNRLQKGDLVFFATAGGKRISHVGIYEGGNKFLHAPGRGRRIQSASLTSNYYSTRYRGARSYL